jgi:hypothetical protein
MTLTPSSLRTDLKCGKGAISKGEKCTKGAATAVNPTAQGKGSNTALKMAAAGGLVIGASYLAGRSGLGLKAGSALKTAASEIGQASKEISSAGKYGLKMQTKVAKQAASNIRGRAKLRALTNTKMPESNTLYGRVVNPWAEGAAQLSDQGQAGRAVQAAQRRFRRRASLRRDAAVFTDKELHATVKAEARRKFKVYPSAYANAWMVKEYKRRGGKFRGDALDTWFKEKWVRMSSSGRILGPCGDRTEGEGKPKCLPAAKAQRLTAAQRRTLVARKRRNDPAKNRGGAPVMVSSKTDIWAAGFDAEDGKKYTKVVTNPETGRKRRIRYGAKGYKIAPGTDKGDRYCARSFGDMKSHGKDCAGADRNTPLCLSRAKWRCSGKASRRDGALTPGK